MMAFTQNNGDLGISHDLRPLRPQNSTVHQSIDRTGSRQVQRPVLSPPDQILEQMQRTADGDKQNQLPNEIHNAIQKECDKFWAWSQIWGYNMLQQKWGYNICYSPY